MTLLYRTTPKSTPNYYTFSLLVSTLSTATHYLTDGILSLPLLSSLVFSTVLHFTYNTRDLVELRQQLRHQFATTILSCFATTILATIRVAIISLHHSDARFSLYLAYLSLFVAFSDNLQITIDIDTSSRISTQPRRNPLRNVPRVAPAA